MDTAPWTANAGGSGGAGRPAGPGRSRGAGSEGRCPAAGRGAALSRATARRVLAPLLFRTLIQRWLPLPHHPAADSRDSRGHLLGVSVGARAGTKSAPAPPPPRPGRRLAEALPVAMTVPKAARGASRHLPASARAAREAGLAASPWQRRTRPSAQRVPTY